MRIYCWEQGFMYRDYFIVPTQAEDDSGWSFDIYNRVGEEFSVWKDKPPIWPTKEAAIAHAKRLTDQIIQESDWDVLYDKLKAQGLISLKQTDRMQDSFRAGDC